MLHLNQNCCICISLSGYPSMNGSLTAVIDYDAEWCSWMNAPRNCGYTSSHAQSFCATDDSSSLAISVTLFLGSRKFLGEPITRGVSFWVYFSSPVHDCCLACILNYTLCIIKNRTFWMFHKVPQFLSSLLSPVFPFPSVTTCGNRHSLSDGPTHRFHSNEATQVAPQRCTFPQKRRSNTATRSNKHVTHRCFLHSPPTY
jgi:hypothetical protein